MGPDRKSHKRLRRTDDFEIISLQGGDESELQKPGICMKEVEMRPVLVLRKIRYFSDTLS